MTFNNPMFKGFKCEENQDEYCSDASRDETLCETCKYYEEHNGIPTCCGHEYKERGDDER